MGKAACGAASSYATARRSSDRRRSLLLEIPRRERSRPVARHLVVALQVGDHVVRLLVPGPEGVEHLPPVREPLAGLFDHLLVADVPVVGLHKSYSLDHAAATARPRSRSSTTRI